MYETSDATSPGDLRRFYELAGPFDHLILALTSGKGGGPFRSLDLDELRRGFDGKFGRTCRRLNSLSVLCGPTDPSPSLARSPRAGPTPIQPDW